MHTGRAAGWRNRAASGSTKATATISTSVARCGEPKSWKSVRIIEVPYT
jgi:hypothetical protein